MGASPVTRVELAAEDHTPAGIDVGVILTGGKSSRMGVDKALMQLDGRTLVERLERVLRDAGARRVVAIGGNVEAILSLGIEAVIDHYPGEGPLGGLLTAADELQVASTMRVAVVACDLPLLRGATIRRLAQMIAPVPGLSDQPLAWSANPVPAVAVPVVDGIRQVHVLVMGADALTQLGAALIAGERSLQAAMDRVEVVEVAGVDPEELHDLDRPEDVDDYHRRFCAAEPDAPPY